MKYIVAGTNRPESRSLALGSYVQSIYKALGEDVELFSLEDVGVNELSAPAFGNAEGQGSQMRSTIEKINHSEGLIFIVPEYNGSYPGALKYFIDHWDYPASFEHRPIAFIGIGGRFGGLRPVEHLQGVFGYRNAYMFPDRVFISNVWDVMEGSEVKDETIQLLLKAQAEGFQKFVTALKSQNLIPT